MIVYREIVDGVAWDVVLNERGEELYRVRVSASVKQSTGD